jgi:hypothetical protein
VARITGKVVGGELGQGVGFGDGGHGVQFYFGVRVGEG